jgi:glycosyltransferase involved in cell wall biosynthesis
MKIITILLPVHQRKDIELNFEKTFKSLINNSYKNFNIILLIDGNLKKSFHKKINNLKKIKYFKILQSKKVGLSRLLNKGIDATHTEWIARVDSDDLYLKDFLKNGVNLIKQGYDFFGGQILEIKNNNKILFTKKVPTSENDIKKYIKFRNPFNHMTVFFKKNIAKKLGGYPNFYLKEDYALWIKFIHYGAKFCNSNKVFAHARTNVDFFKRRIGFQHLRSEFQIQRLLLKSKLTNFFTAFCVFLSRSFIMLMPSTIFKFIYKKFLRD